MTAARMGYRATVIGATGAVGSAVVRELLQSPQCSGVVALVRRPLAITDAKLTQHVVAFDELRERASHAVLGCNVAFCCLGVGQPSKETKEHVWRVDVVYVEAFADVCKAAGVRHISLLGSMGASSTSSHYYLRVKAAAEDALKKHGFLRTSLFRPSLLVTQEARYGFTEHLARCLIPALSCVLPSNLHAIKVEELARAMVINAETPPTSKGGVEILYYADFKRLLAQGLSRQAGQAPVAVAAMSVATATPVVLQPVEKLSGQADGKLAGQPAAGGPLPAQAVAEAQQVQLNFPHQHKQQPPQHATAQQLGQQTAQHTAQQPPAPQPPASTASAPLPSLDPSRTRKYTTHDSEPEASGASAPESRSDSYNRHHHHSSSRASKPSRLAQQAASGMRQPPSSRSNPDIAGSYTALHAEDLHDRPSKSSRSRMNGQRPTSTLDGAHGTLSSSPSRLPTASQSYKAFPHHELYPGAQAMCGKYIPKPKADPATLLRNIESPGVPRSASSSMLRRPKDF